MTTINLALPLIQCTSCNKYIAHLIPFYYKFIHELDNLLKINFDFNNNYDMINYNGDNIYKLFIQPYYLYTDDIDKNRFDFRAIIIYALQMTKEDFPLRKDLNIKYNYCCSRMFLCDSSSGWIN